MEGREEQRDGKKEKKEAEGKKRGASGHRKTQEILDDKREREGVGKGEKEMRGRSEEGKGKIAQGRKQIMGGGVREGFRRGQRGQNAIMNVSETKDRPHLSGG